MVGFNFSANRKIIFGQNKTASVIPYLKEEGGKILILSGRSILSSPQWKELTQGLKREGLSFERAVISGEPSPEDIDSICRQYAPDPPSAILAIGGGSVLDAGKAVSAMLCEQEILEGSGSVQHYLEGVGTKNPSGERLPLFAIPSTAGTGSECTKNAVISSPGINGFKKSLRHDKYIPDLAIVDSTWLNSLPRSISASCGMDAFSQLLESFLSTSSSPMTDALALEGLKGFIQSFTPLLKAAARENDLDNIALGASLSGLTLANAGLGTVHGIAGTIGGLCSIPHGTACGLLLPPVMKKSFKALLSEDDNNPALKKIQTLSAYIMDNKTYSVSDSVEIFSEQLDKWAELADLPGLKAMGFEKEMIIRAASESGNKNNPYLFTEQERVSLLEEVF